MTRFRKIFLGLVPHSQNNVCRSKAPQNNNNNNNNKSKLIKTGLVSNLKNSLKGSLSGTLTGAYGITALAGITTTSIIASTLVNTALTSAIGSSVHFEIQAADTLTVDVSSNNVVLNVVPESNGKFVKSNDITIDVGTNSTNGYTLSMMTSNTDLVRDTKLTNNSSNNTNTANTNNTNNTNINSNGYPIIPTLTTSVSEDNFTLNHWGYKLNSFTGDVNSDSITTDDNYLGALPIVDLGKLTGKGGSGTANITLATKLDNNVPSGTYTNTLTFIAIANTVLSTCNPNTICYNGNGADLITKMGNQTATNGSTTTLWASNYQRQGYGFAGWSTEQQPQNQNENNTLGPNQIIELTGNYANSTTGLQLYARWIPTSGYMQTFTEEQCNNLTTNQIIALTDQRDSNVYAVAKYGDGKCWMMENLRLDNTAELSITNTNNPNLPLTQSNGQTAIGEPEDHLSPTSSDWCTVRTSECYDISNLNTINTVYTGDENTGTAPIMTKRSQHVYSYGNFYNYYSATAGHGTSKIDGSADGDICPAGWKLPQGGESSTPGSFSHLDVTMGGSGKSTRDQVAIMRWSSYPYNFIYSSEWRSSGMISEGIIGYYWSAYGEGEFGYLMSFALSLVNSYIQDTLSPGTNSYYKYDGYSVRCVTKN